MPLIMAYHTDFMSQGDIMVYKTILIVFLSSLLHMSISSCPSIENVKGQLIKNDMLNSLNQNIGKNFCIHENISFEIANTFIKTDNTLIMGFNKLDATENNNLQVQSLSDINGQQNGFLLCYYLIDYHMDQNITKDHLDEKFYYVKDRHSKKIILSLKANKLSQANINYNENWLFVV